ncbi:MAG: SDR family NAD(P)-dependent oxidoreductase, partial [Chloroflexi bacterium]
MQEGSCVQEPLGLYNLAYTLQMGREAMEERLALQVGSPVELEEKLGRYLHNPQEETGDWYRGQVKRYKDLVVSLSADEELQEAIVKWLQRGKYERLLEWWVKGLEIPWQYLYTVGAGLAPALPQRLSLPTYPFGKERYWVDLIAVGQPGKSQSLSSRNTTSQEEVCQTNASATARTMFLTPIWQKDAIVGPHIAQETALPVTLILLCDLPDIAASSIQAQMATGGHCRSLSSAQSRRELRFQDAVVQLIQELQHLLQAKSVEPMLVQVVVADREEPSRLSALAGVLKTAQQEYPQLAGQLIEVEGEADEETLLAKLRENQYRSQQLHIRYRDGQRWVKLWQEHPAPIQTRPKESSFPWKEGGCYLIIGGAGGLARLFVQEIAQQVQEATIFLIGRSELDASQRAALMPTGSGGISIDYQQVDVSDGSAVHALMQRVQQKSGHLDGIIHAAGVLRDSLLRNKTAEEVLAVLSPKVIAVEVLDEQSREMALDFFVLCSSFVAVGGNVGQADYAGANAYLDAFAHTRRAQVLAGKRQGETVSINWPLWEEGGMHIESAKREMMRERLGLDEMGTEIGMMTLYQALALRQAQVVVLYGQVERIRQQWLQGHVSPVSANLVGEGRQGQSLGPLQYGGTSEADERIVGAGSEPRTIPTAPAFGPIDTSLSQLAPMGASPTPTFSTDKLCE